MKVKLNKKWEEMNKIFKDIENKYDYDMLNDCYWSII